MPKPAVLLLKDGRKFHGKSFGAEGETTGEVCFNTGMTGYQEILTDPSYCRQIVTMTSPHIANTGCGIRRKGRNRNTVKLAGRPVGRILLTRSGNCRNSGD